MRIAYVSTYLPQRCGIATYTDYLVHGIRRVDPEVEIRVVAEKGASALKEKNFEVIPCWDRNEDYVEPILAHTEDADVVHVQHEYSIYRFDDRLPSVLSRLTDVEKVVTIHCVRPGQFSERGAVDENYARRIAQLADKVIVHLDSQKAILARLGIPPEKMHVIPHGTKISNEEREASRKRLNLPEEDRIILMFGFVKPHKCLHIALDALKEMLEKTDVYLFVAGGLAPNASEKERDYIKFIERRIEELKIHDNIIFPNRFFPNEDVPYLFGACDLVLFPYYEEDRSASGSFHLAIGAKKPVIASRIPKFEELRNICDELLVLPYNASGIAGVALRLLQEVEFEKYVLDRTDEYRKLTSWHAVAEKHLNLYKEVLE